MRFFPSFYEKYVPVSDSEIAEKLLAYVTSHKSVLKVQLAFVETSMKDLYQTIKVWCGNKI